MITLTENEYDELGRRLGPKHLTTRRQRQQRYSHHAWTPRSILHRPEHLLGVMPMIRVGLTLLGMWPRGRRNFRNFEVVRRDAELPHLPTAFDGFTALQLTDLHLDIDPQLVPAIQTAIGDLDYDVCLLTGDYSLEADGTHEAALHLLQDLLAAVDKPTYGILGNHDFVEITPRLEQMGVRVLLNEHDVIERDGDRLYLIGVDDIWYYQTADIDRALAGVPPDAATVLLAHNPDFCTRLEDHPVGLMLCGHTHGGQICLPGGRAVITHTSLPQDYVSGPWQYGATTGYTSRGTGGSGQPVRFNCRPEITLHRLVCPASKPAG